MTTVRLPHVPSAPAARTARTGLAAAALLLGLAGLTGCGSDDGGTAADPAGSSAPVETGTATLSPDPSTSATPPQVHRAYAPRDYDYTLGLQCMCPVVDGVRVSVRDGAVTDVVATKGDAGAPVPAAARLSIQDIIDRANEAEAKGGKVEVTWPATQDHPAKVAIDTIPRATDDEVTYTITDVQER